MADIDVLAPYLENLRRGGSHVWTAANCPSCSDCRPDGDRLRIWPDSESDGRGSWSCRRCGAHGDCIDLLMRLCPSMSFPDAWARILPGVAPPEKRTKTCWWRARMQERAVKKRLAASAAMAPQMDAALQEAAARAVHVHRRTDAPAIKPLPPSAWSGTVGTVFRAAQEDLLTAPEAVSFLADRGVTPDAAYAAGCFGWLSSDVWLDNVDCGLDRTGYRGPRWPLPAGLMVVSWAPRHDGWTPEVIAASVHCLDRTRWDKRRSAPGVPARATVLQPADGQRPDLVMIMESALDALLAWEASGRRALCIGVGGTWMPDDLADAAVCAAHDAGAPIVLVPDADDAGRDVAAKWRRRWPTASVVEAVGGKDLSDADRAARAGVSGALRASAWMAMVRERLLNPGSSVKPS